MGAGKSSPVERTARAVQNKGEIGPSGSASGSASGLSFQSPVEAELANQKNRKLTVVYLTLVKAKFSFLFAQCCAQNLQWLSAEGHLLACISYTQRRAKADKFIKDNIRKKDHGLTSGSPSRSSQLWHWAKKKVGSSAKKGKIAPTPFQAGGAQGGKSMEDFAEVVGRLTSGVVAVSPSKTPRRSIMMRRGTSFFKGGSKKISPASDVETMTQEFKNQLLSLGDTALGLLKRVQKVKESIGRDMKGILDFNDNFWGGAMGKVQQSFAERTTGFWHAMMILHHAAQGPDSPAGGTQAGSQAGSRPASSCESKGE